MMCENISTVLLLLYSTYILNYAGFSNIRPFRNDWIWRWIRLRLAWPPWLFGQGFRREDGASEAESKAEAVVSKKAIDIIQMFIKIIA